MAAGRGVGGRVGRGGGGGAAGGPARCRRTTSTRSGGCRRPAAPSARGRRCAGGDARVDQHGARRERARQRQPARGRGVVRGAGRVGVDVELDRSGRPVTLPAKSRSAASVAGFRSALSGAEGDAQRRRGSAWHRPARRGDHGHGRRRRRVHGCGGADRRRDGGDRGAGGGRGHGGGGGFGGAAGGGRGRRGCGRLRLGGGRGWRPATARGDGAAGVQRVERRGLARASSAPGLTRHLRRCWNGPASRARRATRVTRACAPRQAARPSAGGSTPVRRPTSSSVGCRCGLAATMSLLPRPRIAARGRRRR